MRLLVGPSQALRAPSAAAKIARDRDVVELAASQGVVTRGGTPEQLAEFLARDIAIWQQVVKEAGIKAE